MSIRQLRAAHVARRVRHGHRRDPRRAHDLRDRRDRHDLLDDQHDPPHRRRHGARDGHQPRRRGDRPRRGASRTHSTSTTPIDAQAGRRRRHHLQRPDPHRVGVGQRQHRQLRHRRRWRQAAVQARQRHGHLGRACTSRTRCVPTPPSRRARASTTRRRARSWSRSPARAATASRASRSPPRRPAVAPAITDPIDPTDVDGCAYVLKVPPGTYNLTITKSGYIDTTQTLLPITQSVVVTAGAATPVAFQHGPRHTYTVKYAANSTRDGQAADQPRRDVLRQSAAGPLTESAPGTRKLYPWAAGYQAVGGNPTTCAAVDPEKWAADTTKEAGAARLQGPRRRRWRRHPSRRHGRRERRHPRIVEHTTLDRRRAVIEHRRQPRMR